MTRWLETDSLSNQDISSALAIGAYTADADRLILVQWMVDQVAGNGDYTFYLTQQIGGAGSAYRYIPITEAAAASGLTAIAGQSIMIAARNGDVLTLYLDGLAGDTTTPDTTVRWFEMAALRPATADRTLVVDASGQVSLTDDAITAAKFDESTAYPLKAADVGATYIARTGADSDTLETLSDQVDAVPTTAEIWAALSDTEKEAIADAILSRGVANIEDTAEGLSLAEMLLALFESKIENTTWTIYKSDHATTFSTRTVTTSGSANPIVEVT